jgi:hypothetical protein
MMKTCPSLNFSRKRHKLAHYKTMTIFCDNNTSFLKNLACYLCNTSFAATLFLLVAFFMVEQLHCFLGKDLATFVCVI